MTSNLIKVGGAVTFWSLTRWHGRETLKAELENLLLAQYVPPARGPLQALRDSLNATFPRHSVEYTLGKKFYQVDQILRRDDEVEHKKVCLASIDNNNGITIDPYNYEIAREVLEKFNTHLGLVTGDAVSQSLIRYCDHLGGTRLRPVGGIYWLPDHRLDEWQQVTRLVEQSAIGTSTCYCIRHNMDEEAVRAVRDAICAEVKSQARSLQQEIESGDLREKVKLYEDILGVALDSLHTACDQAEQASAVAGMIESVAGGVEEADAVLA